MIRTYKYRLYPSRSQEKSLLLIVEMSRQFYNMLVGERKWAYQLEGRHVSKKEQLRQVKYYKATFPQAQQVHSHVLQVVATDVDKAFGAFFRRVKAGEKPGYPRFKGRQWFHSFGLKELGNGFKIDGRRLKLFGIGRVSVRWHRPVEGTIKAVRIVHQAGQWFACFACEVEVPDLPPATGRDVGIDVGVSALLTTSDGSKVDNPAYYRAGQKRLRVLQRKLARAQRGSQNRRKVLRQVQRQQAHVAHQRADFLHKLSRYLVDTYDRIALEDLQIKNMVRNHHLSKSILDSGWATFRHYLAYKAESAGCEIAVVNPAYTSKSCSACGAVFPHFDLSVRWVTCGCGLSLDRDHNAAINILSRAGWDTPVLVNVAPLLASSDPGKDKRPTEATRLKP